jgi:hypothetical protein
VYTAAAQHPRQARLRELQRGTTLEAALAFYDTLGPAGVEEVIGSWRGEGLPDGPPLRWSAREVGLVRQTL